LGSTVRLGSADPNPLLDRTRNPYAINHTPQFGLADLMNPTRMLCKVDQVMDAYSGQIDVHEDPDAAPQFIHKTDLQLQTYGDLDVEPLVAIRKNDQEINLERLSYDEQLFVQRMALYEKYKAQQSRTPGMIEIRRKMTSKDKFNEYCQEEDAKEIKQILEQKHNITVTATDSSTEEGEDYSSGSGDYDGYDDVVEVKSEFLEQNDDEMSELEVVARLGDRSLLAERMTDLVDGEEKEAMEKLITKFNIVANGRIEKVMQVDTKKGAPVLLVQFDSSKFRDEVLKGSRRPESRSQSTVRFRRPKVKDLKHVVNLVRRH